MTALVDNGSVRVGISGWRYEPWRKLFYPETLAQRLELHYASRKLSSLEINGSFYSLQTPKLYRRWYEDTPDDFVFSLKGPRYITHMKKLNDVAEPLADFFASGVLRLEEKLGPILFQFPANMRCNLERFEKFFELLPRDTAQANTLAGKHSSHVEGGAESLSTSPARSLRYAVEARSPDAARPEFIELLAKHGIACVVGDAPSRFPYIEDVTSDFMYLRLHCDEAVYANGYTKPALARWAERIRSWRAGGEPVDAARVLGNTSVASTGKPRDVYVYFDNDDKLRSPFDAMALSKLLGIEPSASLQEPKPKPKQAAKQKPKPKLQTARAKAPVRARGKSAR